MLKITKKPKISILVEILSIGGLEQVALNLAKSLTDRGYEVILVGCKRKAEQGRVLLKVPENIQVRKFDNLKQAKDYIVNEFKPDINITEVYYTVKNNEFTEGWGEIKQILCIHSDILLRFLNQLPIFFDVWKKYNVITALTKEAVNELSYFFDNLSYIPNYINFEDKSNNSAGKNIIFVGRFYELIKNPFRIFNIFSEVLKLDKEAKLTIVGAYDLNLIENGVSLSYEMDRLGIKDKISFVGSTTDVEKYYKQADIFLLASRYEGLPMVLIEASQYGIPRISTRFTGVDDVIIDGENGYVFEQDENNENIAKKIVELLNNKVLARKIGENARVYAKANFDESIVMQRWEDLFKLMMETKTKEDLNRKLKTINEMDNVYRQAHKEKVIVRLVKVVNSNLDEIRKLRRELLLAKKPKLTLTEKWIKIRDKIRFWKKKKR